MDGVDPSAASAPSTAEPVCPRHPDRVSYVRCQRCERPTCPACQRQAAVGFQCVDCVREQAASTPVARTALGGQLGGSGRPVVTLAIIGLCVVVYLLQLSPTFDITQRLAFAPFYAESEPWRFITSAFLHQPGVPVHILFNMYLLYQIGPFLEQQLGRVRFSALYLICAIGGSVGYLLLANPAVESSWYSTVIGASGAVFGLFGALLIVNRRLGLDSRGILALVAINAVIGFVPGFNIAWQAHLGGLLTGVLVAAVLVYSPRERRSLLQTTGMIGVVLLLVAASLAKLASA